VKHAISNGGFPQRLKCWRGYDKEERNAYLLSLNKLPFKITFLTSEIVKEINTNAQTQISTDY